MPYRMAVAENRCVEMEYRCTFGVLEFVIVRPRPDSMLKQCTGQRRFPQVR